MELIVVEVGAKTLVGILDLLMLQMTGKSVLAIVSASENLSTYVALATAAGQQAIPVFDATENNHKGFFSLVRIFWMTFSNNPLQIQNLLPKNNETMKQLKHNKGSNRTS